MVKDRIWKYALGTFHPTRVQNSVSGGTRNPLVASNISAVLEKRRGEVRVNSEKLEDAFESRRAVASKLVGFDHQNLCHWEPFQVGMKLESVAGGQQAAGFGIF